MNRTLGKALIVASCLASAFFIHFGFSDKTKDFGWFVIMGFIAALLLIISLSVAYSLGMGRPTFIFSLDKTKKYKLISMVETTNGKFLYVLENKQGDSFFIISEERSAMATGPFVCPVFVVIRELNNRYVLLVCGQSTTTFEETPA